MFIVAGRIDTDVITIGQLTLDRDLSGTRGFAGAVDTQLTRSAFLATFSTVIEVVFRVFADSATRKETSGAFTLTAVAFLATRTGFVAGSYVLFTTVSVTVEWIYTDWGDFATDGFVAENGFVGSTGDLALAFDTIEAGGTGFVALTTMLCVFLKVDTGLAFVCEFTLRRCSRRTVINTFAVYTGFGCFAGIVAFSAVFDVTFEVHADDRFVFVGESTFGGLKLSTSGCTFP